jgi:ATP-binding cassette, subfamily B (MDR/TAP), member 1
VRDSALFATTIKENVARGLIGTRYEHANEDEKFALIKACTKANAERFINKMPLGYDTMVGVGVTLRASHPSLDPPCTSNPSL